MPQTTRGREVWKDCNSEKRAWLVVGKNAGTDKFWSLCACGCYSSRKSYPAEKKQDESLGMTEDDMERG